MRHTTYMLYENARMFFVALLYVSFGIFCALAVYNLVTWGTHLDYLLAAGIVVVSSLAGVVFTSV